MCIYMYKMCVYTTLSLTKCPPAYTPTHTHTHTPSSQMWKWGKDGGTKVGFRHRG